MNALYEAQLQGKFADSGSLFQTLFARAGVKPAQRAGAPVGPSEDKLAALALVFQVSTLLDLSSFLSRDVFSFVKFFDAVQSDADPDNFYMEREWRILDGLSFDLTDVHRVILPKAYAARFRGELGAYTGAFSPAPEVVIRDAHARRICTAPAARTGTPPRSVADTDCARLSPSTDSSRSRRRS